MACSCCSSTIGPTALPLTDSPQVPASDSGGDVATCPVMTGTPVVKAIAEAQGLFRDYQGTRYWFCCAGCGPKFDADPQRYATAS